MKRHLENEAKKVPCPHGCGHMARSDNIKTHTRSCPRRNMANGSPELSLPAGPQMEAEGQRTELPQDALAYAYHAGNSTGYASTDRTYM